MLINGAEPDQNFVLRKVIGASEIVYMNTTTIAFSIDNEPLITTAIEKVSQTLANATMARVRLQLENAPGGQIAPVKSNYDITIRIARSAQLLAVEQAFGDHLNVENLSGDSVTAFLADPRCQGAGGDYATGMAEYAFGVLNKEGRHDQHIKSPLSRYREHFGSALPKLALHQRALPRLLSAFMSFSLNDFSRAGEATGHVGLDAATATLAHPKPGLQTAVRSAKGSMRNVCPIDHGTDRILRLADHLASANRWSPVLNDECRQVANATQLDLMDQEKAFALWALAALHHKATRDAIEPLERIAATYPFAEWASASLDAVNA